MTDPFGPFDDDYAGVSYDEPECDGCDLDDLTDVELRSTPCGQTLCSDCAFEHRDCPQCADALYQDEMCDRYHALKDDDRL